MTNAYDDPYLARLYDHLNAWGPDNDFYLSLVRGARAVLDVGCGTGTLLHRARAQGHTGRLVGLDPAAAMLDRARVRTDIEWVHGDLTTVDWKGEFDLAVMTGHAFQELLSDDETVTALTAVRHALTPDGLFAFETRNPVTRDWLAWTPDRPMHTRDADGAPLTQVHEATPPDSDGLVSLTTTYTGPSLPEPRSYHGYMRFVTGEHLDTLLAAAGLEVAQRFGDWDRSPYTPTSEEIITIARRAAAG